MGQEEHHTGELPFLLRRIRDVEGEEEINLAGDGELDSIHVNY